MEGKIWVAEAVRPFTSHRSAEEARREGYIQALVMLVAHARDEEKPLLRIVEFSVQEMPEKNEMRVRATGFESDLDYDEFVQRRDERGKEDAL